MVNSIIPRVKNKSFYSIRLAMRVGKMLDLRTPVINWRDYPTNKDKCQLFHMRNVIFV
jgi:hypothetical protein